MEGQNQTCNLVKPPWTAFEKQYESFRHSQCENSNDLYEAIKQRMQDSSLASFIFHLNKAQEQDTYIQQDKLDRYLFDIGKGLVNIKKMERLNDFCEDLLRSIDIYLRNSNTGKLTVKKVLKNLNVLRLIGSKIASMDDSLSRLEDLDVQVLAGNCLSSCPGGSLPCGLVVLELCCNFLENISTLSDNPPPHLLYLGLARNKLSCDVLSPLNKFQFLYHLDLAQNNIEYLCEVVSACSTLENLSSLLLIGNPCSMSPNYSTFIQHNLQRLIYLDGERLKSEENGAKHELQIEQLFFGSLQVNLFRIMGLPQPANQKINKKKVIHSYRLEMESPLLQQFLPKREKRFIIDESLVQYDGEVNESNKKDNKKKKDNKEDNLKSDVTKEKKYNSSGEVKSKGGKKKDSKDDNVKSDKTKEKSKSSGEIKSTEKKTLKGKNEKEKKKGNKDEKEKLSSEEDQEAQMYEQELKLLDQISKSDCFKSERKSWGKIIEFDEPTIEVSNCDLWSLRNVFRTGLTLRIVHLKVLPPDLKSRGNQKKQEIKATLNENNKSEEDVNKEILVSKSTIAQIKVPLQDIIWNTKYLEYSWTIKNPFTVEATKDLKDLHFVVKKKKERKLP